MKLSQVDTVVDTYLSGDIAKGLLANLEKDYVIPQDTFKQIYAELIKGFLKQYIAMMSTSETTQAVPGGAVGTIEPSGIFVASAVDTMVKAFVEQEIIHNGQYDYIPFA